MGASTDDGVTALMAQLAEPDKEPLEIAMQLMENSASLPSPALASPYLDCGTGLKAVDIPKQVQGRIALIQRGENTFREKALLAQQAGAIACVIYNNRDGSFFGSLGEHEDMPAIPVVAVSQADGMAMLQAITGNGRPSSAELRLRPEEVPQPYRMAEFSSRGPSRALGIKPELTAPGVNIDSATVIQAAYPGGGMPDPSGYTSASGTSMATPHVAGAAALIRQAHPDWTSLQIKAALVNTARWMEGQGSVTDQGNGAMDLMRAMDCKAVLVTAAAPFSPTHSFGRIGHEGKARTVAQALTIQPLAGEPDPSPYRLSVELNGQPKGLEASLSAGSIICQQSCVASFDLTITANGAELADGRYYGFVKAEAEWGTLRLPFFLEANRKPLAQPIVPEFPAEEQGGTPERRPIGSMPRC